MTLQISKLPPIGNKELNTTAMGATRIYSTQGAAFSAQAPEPLGSYLGRKLDEWHIHAEDRLHDAQMDFKKAAKELDEAEKVSEEHPLGLPASPFDTFNLNDAKSSREQKFKEVKESWDQVHLIEKLQDIVGSVSDTPAGSFGPSKNDPVNNNDNDDNGIDDNGIDDNGIDDNGIDN